MSELYNILSIFVTSGLLLACGLMLLFMNIPGSPLLGNYRKARYMLACAYLFFVVFEIVEYLLQSPPPCRALNPCRPLRWRMLSRRLFCSPLRYWRW
jgi:hypothetical protein